MAHETSLSMVSPEKAAWTSVAGYTDALDVNGALTPRWVYRAYLILVLRFLSLFCAGFDGRLRCSMRLHYQVQRRVVGDNSRCLTTASPTSTPVRRLANLLPNQQSKEQRLSVKRADAWLLLL